MQTIGLFPADYHAPRRSPSDFWDYGLGLSGGSAVQALYYMPRIGHPLNSVEDPLAVPTHHAPIGEPIALISPAATPPPAATPVDSSTMEHGIPRPHAPGQRLARTKRFVETAQQYDIIKSQT